LGAVRWKQIEWPSIYLTNKCANDGLKKENPSIRFE